MKGLFIAFGIFLFLCILDSAVVTLVALLAGTVFGVSAIIKAGEETHQW